MEIKAHDGVDLHGTIYRSAGRRWQSPVLLVNSPYFDYAGVIEGHYRNLVDFFTPKGYAVVFADLRGTGNSGGCIELSGPNERRDFKTWVEYLASQQWSNGNVGSYGISYDGELQNGGAIMRPKGLKTIVPIAAVSGAYEWVYFEGVPIYLNGPLGWAAYAVDNQVPGTAPERVAERPGCHPEIASNYSDPSGDMTKFWREREYRRGVRRVRASVLFIQGFLDRAVAPVNMVGWFDELPSFKRAVLGQWGHAFPPRADHMQMLHAWFDHELLALETRIEEWPAVQVQSEERNWRAVRSFRQMGREKPFVLGRDLLNEGGSSFGEFEAGTWMTPPLERSVHLSGQAMLEAFIELDRDDAHFSLTISELTPTGTERYLTNGYLSARHRDSLSKPEAVPVGGRVRYKIRTYPIDRSVQRGSRIVMSISGSDIPSQMLPAGNAWSATMNPFTSRLWLPIAVPGCEIDIGTGGGSAEPCAAALRSRLSS